MKKTNIQWCHSTVNPVMGCDGCELWRSAAFIARRILDFLAGFTRLPKAWLETVIFSTISRRETSDLYQERELIAKEIAEKACLDNLARERIVDIIRSECKCYAGLIGTFRAGHKGYADAFATPKLFPGRMAKAANWPAPSPAEITDKPWLEGLRRLIFVSDMGDALSGGIPFDFLMEEIIRNVASAAGQRHIWLWLSKRPGRMAAFGEWLQSRNVGWPANLVPMTTVTGPRTAQRVEQLRRVPSPSKGLSLEPLLAPVSLDLRGIHWVIAGGGSDVLAEPFHVEWALALQRQCHSEGVAFFLKQVGKHPFHQGKPLELNDLHGGDWTEWPQAWRVRKLPKAFRASGAIALSEDSI